VLVMTLAGNSRRVAVTSTWQALGHVKDGVVVVPGGGVLTTVVIPKDVVVMVAVDRIVDVIVLAGSVVVSVTVVPALEIVVVTTSPGRVVVAS
jgi:hypothetical protein